MGERYVGEHHGLIWEAPHNQSYAAKARLWQVLLLCLFLFQLAAGGIGRVHLMVSFFRTGYQG